MTMTSPLRAAKVGLSSVLNQRVTASSGAAESDGWVVMGGSGLEFFVFGYRVDWKRRLSRRDRRGALSRLGQAHLEWA